MKGLFFWLLPAALICGCAHSVDQRGAALIKAEHALVKISEIDGKSQGNWFLRTKGIARAHLSPGNHTLTILSINGTSDSISAFKFSFSVKAGSVYLIKDDADEAAFMKAFRDGLLNRHTPALAKVWIVDRDTDQKVGELLESQREPVRDGEFLGIPPLVTWEHRPEKGMEIWRSSDSLTIAWSPTNENESHFVTINVRKPPSSTNPDEIGQHVEQNNKQLIEELNKFGEVRDFEQSVEPFRESKNACVQYKRFFSMRVNHSPRGILAGDPLGAFGYILISPLLGSNEFLEIYGYSCRSTKNKDLEIDFSYTRRSDSRERRPEMAPKAKSYFEDLRF